MESFQSIIRLFICYRCSFSHKFYHFSLNRNILKDILNLLPDVTNPEFVKSMNIQTNDEMMVIYMGSLIRSVIALHDLITNKVIKSRIVTQSVEYFINSLKSFNLKLNYFLAETKNLCSYGCVFLFIIYGYLIFLSDFSSRR